MPFAGAVHPGPLQQFQIASAGQLAITGLIGRCRSSLISCRRSGIRSLDRTYSSTGAVRSALHNLREKSQEQRTLVFQSTSDNPYHNLAIEHFLLINSDVNSHILLLYTNRPCVVFGRNQNPWTECNLKLMQEGVDGKSIELVRRRSGGGTVFHDEGNLNFSVIVPNDKAFNRRKHSEMVVRALGEIQSIFAEYDGPEDIWVNDRHDITMATMQNKGRSEFKVSGSAFKLTRGRALHHGTLLHSSPNLENISRLLRAPGKDWIRAKGVESVRSPVMNLFNVRDIQERMDLRSQLIREITKQFLRLYEADAVTELVGDRDCQEDVNPDVSKGVYELLTDQWRFEQTPGFDFTSRVTGGKEVTFTVKSGIIQEPRFGPQELAVAQRSKLQVRDGQQKVHQIRDWCDVFDPGSIDDDQLATIAQVFPDLQKLLHKTDPDISVNDVVVEQQKGGVLRRRQDGSLEKETGFNTVEEIKG